MKKMFQTENNIQVKNVAPNKVTTSVSPVLHKALRLNN